MPVVLRKALIAPTALIALLAFTMLTAFRMLQPVTTVYEVPVVTVSEVKTETPAFSTASISEEVLWLARCIYSETKRPEEQELVAWVIRNRVETEYRGRSTYQGVVLDPYQFSAFNPGSRKRRFHMNLSPSADARGWVRTMKIAHSVYHADASERPFPVTTRHFYSEQSMVGRRAPRWVDGRPPVRLTGVRIDPRRFRFYSGIV